MRDNTITATAGDKTYIKTDPVFQYDFGLKLIIDGVTLPEEYEVQFSNTDSASSKSTTGNANGVEIPDEYLRNGEDIHAYLFLHTTEDDGFSVYHIHIPVIGRPAIGREEITPIDHTEIQEALAAMQEAVEQTEANVAHYPYINEDKYWMVYDAVLDEFVNTGVYAQGDNTYDLSIGTVETLAPGQPATASMTWVDRNAFLNLGLPIPNMSSIVSVYEECTDTNDITIYDGADDMPVSAIRIQFVPIQEGSGDPSPRNIRRISGVYGTTLVHIVGENATTYATDFEDEAGVVYSALFYPMTGKLVVDKMLITKNCRDMDNLDVQPGWNNSGVRQLVGAGVSQVFAWQTLNIGTVFGVDTTGENDLLYLPLANYGMRQSEWINTEINVQVCVPLAEPIEYTFESYTPRVQLGENSYALTAGKIAYMKYPCDTKLYIDNKIAEVQALVLEH